MTIDLKETLPTLLPKACSWVAEQERIILKAGYPLSEDQLTLARCVGVRNPEEIRIKLVSTLPLPNDPQLKEATIQKGLLGPNMIGVTFNYGLYICQGHEEKPELIAHECRHVHQYENAGSILDFLTEYLQQIINFGYSKSPLEDDAREAAERCT